MGALVWTIHPSTDVRQSRGSVLAQLLGFKPSISDLLDCRSLKELDDSVTCRLPQRMHGALSITAAWFQEQRAVVQYIGSVYGNDDILDGDLIILAQVSCQGS